MTLNLKDKFKQFYNNKPFSTVIWASGLFIGLTLIFLYWWYQSYFPETDDSYVGAHIVYVSPQITAPVKATYVENFQKVKKGQLLVELDPRPYIIALQQAEAGLITTEQNVSAQAAAVNAAKAEMSKAQALLTVQEQNAPRILTLVQTGKISKAEGTKAQGDLDTARAAFKAAQENYLEAQRKLGQSIAQNPEILMARAKVDEAKLQLSYTRITSPADGTIVNFTARPGTLVSVQQIIFSVVDQTSWWVDANFKETQLERIRKGQSATINLDLYPNIDFHGIVENISPGSGSAFSLLPPENATGNWVKVTQRFAVRIKIENPNPNFPLRVGASANVKVNTL